MGMFVYIIGLFVGLLCGRVAWLTRWDLPLNDDDNAKQRTRPYKNSNYNNNNYGASTTKTKNGNIILEYHTVIILLLYCQVVAGWRERHKSRKPSRGSLKSGRQIRNLAARSCYGTRVSSVRAYIVEP